jgi:hypothetical protein
LGQNKEEGAGRKGKPTVIDTSFTDRIRYLNPDILVDSQNIPVEKRQYYFPLVFFPVIKYLPEYKDSNSILIYSSWGLTGDTLKVYGEFADNEYDTSDVAWPSWFLRALNEPLLFNNNTNKETYRFTWLRTFDDPICIRIENDCGKYSLVWKVNNGEGGYAPGPTTIVERKNLTKHDWDKFQTMLNSIDFWNTKNFPNMVGLDGSTWVLEGSTPSRYQVLDMWSPHDGSSFFKTCDFLIELTGMKIEDKY